MYMHIYLMCVCAHAYVYERTELSPEMSLSNHQLKWKQYSFMIKSTESGLWSQKDLDSNSCCTSCMIFDLEEVSFPF